MKKLTTLVVTLLFVLSIMNTSYGSESNYLRASFTVTDVAGTNFKEITITPYKYANGSKIEDDEDDDYYIFLPSGYFTNAKSALYVADKDGKYPFTVYSGNYKKTFFYTVDGIEDTDSDASDEEDEIYFTKKLIYDYEKKQVIFHMDIDKLRNITTPDGTIISNQVNYYMDDLENNIIQNLSIIIDNNPYEYKVVKQGEFYLLIELSPVNYDNYSTLVEYHGYNFTNNSSYSAYPEKDIYDDNGGYEVLIKSDSSSSQSLFNINIDGIDYRKPEVDVEFLEDYTFQLDIKDDFGLDYMITFDGQYIPIDSGANECEFTYTHDNVINYDGDYIFTVVDKAGNRNVKTVEIESRKTSRIHKINLDVHDYKYTKNLFESKGMEYEQTDENTIYYENILPGYMGGSNNNFKPDSPITRAEMVTVFCRLNNLSYDTYSYLKTKFSDIENHWARDYISMGSSKKYVSGYKDKTFKPDGYVTRAEFCQMLTQISAYKSKLDQLPASSNNNFIDCSGHWAETEILKITSRNLIASSPDYFYPDIPITRGEVVHAINKLYGYTPSYIELNHIISMYNKYFDFTDVKNSNYYNDIIISVVGMYREKIK
ncbi:MAG: S-layer homology domain-containing protein [Sedimentibacter sp.]